MVQTKITDYFKKKPKMTNQNQDAANIQNNVLNNNTIDLQNNMPNLIESIVNTLEAINTPLPN